jgi:putative ABC transport system permease protein
MAMIAARLKKQDPEGEGALGVSLQTIGQLQYGNIKPSLFLLMGAVIFVLLIACSNVANLLLARRVVRQREMSIRSALGALRMRLVRQLFTESVLLSLADDCWGWASLARQSACWSGSILRVCHRSTLFELTLRSLHTRR